MANRMRMDPWLGRILSAAALFAAAALSTVGGTAFAPLYSLAVAGLGATDGWRGGLAAAILSALALFTAHSDATAATRTFHAAILLCLGLAVGLMFDRERRKTSRFQKSTEQLSSVYEKVQANFESMKRVERLSALGQLSAGLAHEIRNPLASIAGAAAILKRQAEMDPVHAKCVSIIANECNRLDGLLTNFLNFAGPRPPRFQTVDVDTVLENVIDLARHGVRGKTVLCEKLASPDLPPVECDPEQLEQVLLNLVINAIEASPDGQTVTISASADEGKVNILVIDHGHGVAQAHVDRLFDPFFTTKEHGTGLGLPVAHQIMTQMGGTLLAQQNAGDGMRFTVVLPAPNGAA